VAEDIPYRSLYRKYRPQSPDEVIGQDHVVRALTGSIREDRLAHAFLFCGPRGTGKTSTARILAKMVNCEKGPTPEPCGVCEQCVRIREGQHLDVVEIDAASHGGVDDARELRERAPTAPAMGREKVYIIDEAQRLSREAFDALLKLFEEPPPAVRFVLATTEPHKMPATIVGRCQRFDFRRIGTDDLAGLLERIAENEGWKLDRSAAESLARQAEGSARDAESLLDQSAVLSAGAITDDTVATLVGAVQTDVQYELADAVAVGDARSVFQVVDRLVQNGQDLRHLTAEVLSHFRDLIIVQAAPDEPAALDVAPEEHARLAAQAAKFTTAELSRVVSLLLAAQADMRWTTSPRLSLELALVRATIPEADPASAGLAARIERLERLAGVSGTAGATESLGVDAAGPRAVDAGATPAGEEVGGERQSPAPAGKGATPAGREVVGDRQSGVPTAKGARQAGKEVVGDRQLGVPADTDAEPATGPRKRPSASEGASAAPGSGDEVPSEPMTGPHAPSTGALDVGAIRRSWDQLLERLRDQRQMILMANLESATAASWDGETLEISFPPGKKFGVEKVQAREAELQAAFVEVFGVSPRIRCLAREDVGDPLLGADDDEHPVTAEDAIARLKAELGAEPEA
jgi:DNA polymerase-3 subunit gamma/tau